MRLENERIELKVTSLFSEFFLKLVYFNTLESTTTLALTRI